MRKSFDGLMAIIRDKYELDPYAVSVLWERQTKNQSTSLR